MTKVISTMAFVILVCSVAGVHASVQVGDHIQIGNGPGTPGGIFYANDLNDADQLSDLDQNNNLYSYDFGTFCVEIEEHINFSSTYAVESISTQTNQTGMELKSYTAWLFAGFKNQTLTGFNFDSPSTMEANTLQLAMWKGMGYTRNEDTNGWYVSGDGYIKASWYDSYIDNLNGMTWEAEFNTDVANNDWSGIGNVRVMNLRKVKSDGYYGAHAQDQLVTVPIPEPISAVVWSLLAISLSGVYVRRDRGLRRDR